MTAPLMVDATGWWIDRLAESALGAAADDRTPDDLASAIPFVRVRRTGGPDDGHLLDYATMTFECYAANQAAANGLAYAVRALVLAVRGTPAGGAVMITSRKLSGPSEIPYENPNVRRSILTMQTVIQTAF